MYLLEILAGVVIALGCVASLCAPNYAGLILFAIGLLMVKRFGLRLLTGKAGLMIEEGIKAPRVMIELGKIFALNIVGTFVAALMVLLMWQTGSPEIALAVERAQVDSLLSMFVRSIFCGMLVYTGVKAETALETIMYVFAFLVCGFTHSIAYSFYFWISVLCTQATAEMLFALLITAVGNVLGCFLIPATLKGAKFFSAFGNC
nr:MAG TPA: Formate/nitrite transporter [Caudoviricetes sp.]